LRSCRRATGDPADTPEAPLQEKRRGELLRESLAKLSPEHSEVIDLVYYHGKSVKEVAEIVGVSEATVKTGRAVSRGPLEYGFPLARRRQEVCQKSGRCKPLPA